MHHTPGPWKVSLTGAFLGAEDSENYKGGYISNGATWIARIGTPADARLIAAAPELLAAVQAIQQGFKDGSIKWAKPRQSDADPYHPANTLMCAALAKAEGRG